MGGIVDLRVFYAVTDFSEARVVFVQNSITCQKSSEEIRVNRLKTEVIVGRKCEWFRR